jgi:hypothetical protein
MRHNVSTLLVAVCFTSALAPGIHAQTFPGAGTDTFPSAAAVTIDLGEGCQSSILLTGPTTVRRDAPQGGGQTPKRIDTEIVAMTLMGDSPFGPVQLQAGSNQVGRASFGQITGNSRTNDFPADSFFDVFFELVIPSLNLRLINLQPLRVQAFIPNIPPISSTFTNLNQVELVDRQNPQQVVGTALQVWHHPAKFGRETKLGLSLNITNGVLRPAPVEVAVCPTNAVPAATAKLRRQTMTAALLPNQPCNEVNLGCTQPLVLEAVLDRNLRPQDWRGHHRGVFRVLCGEQVVAVGKLEGCEGIGTHRDPLDRDCESCADCSHFEGRLKGVIVFGESKGAKIEACYAGEFVDSQGEPIRCCPQPCLPPGGPFRMTIDGVVVHRCILGPAQ